MTMKKFSYLLAITLMVVITPLICFGQNSTTANYLDMSASPVNPEPLQNITITLNSYSFDLDRAQVTWLVNGQIKKTEIGLKEFTVQAGKNGQKTTVGVRVETTEFGLIEKEISLTPSLVDLIYESLSYVPPFYKGRALNPNQGVVLVTAIPELIDSAGNKLLTQNIIYSWKKDGKVQGSSSGLGKNIFVFSGTVPIRDSLIEVTASSLDGSVTASKQINITNIKSAQVIFYEDSPIYGIMFNRAITNTVRMLSDEFKVKAFPYFMSVGYSQSPDLNYKWGINGNPSENLEEDKGAMVFRIENPGTGMASIDLKVESISRIFQFGQNSFNISFEKQ